MHIQSPIFKSHRWSQRSGKAIYYKMDCFQPCGSFKLRGVGQLCKEKAGEGIRHFVIASGGNAGLAVAYAGLELGIRVTVVVPESTKEPMRARIRSLGAELEVVGKNWNASHLYTLELAQEANTYYVHPFDHPSLWAGHATMIEEAAEQLSEAPDLVVLSVGGGGLFAGVMQGIEELGWSSTKVLCMETDGAASLARSVAAGEHLEIPAIESIATSLGARKVADKAWAYAQLPNVLSSTVDDAATIAAMQEFFDEYKVLVEPACGAALAAVYQQKPELAEAASILVIVCGGSGGEILW